MLRWQLGAFNKNPIKNDAGHSAQGRAAKPQFTAYSNTPLCLPVLLCLLIEFYDYA